ncbi:MAG TPA: ATP-binding protein [Candidatus Sulfomarinibacteraceae bacterium]|nr:ATP-binding protein [Candidatus Sulfomarinibacteraceae bacterium]
MVDEVVILMLEAILMYLLVLGAHSLRHRFGPVHFYALIGGVTAIMSWVTDAGLTVTLGDITFVVGSTVFYTSLLLGVFVVYVFDGPRATRITISTVLGVSIMMPIIAAALHFQTTLIGGGSLAGVPLPSLRINAASVTATFLDLIFLGIAWEFLGKPALRMGLWFRTWLTLLAVMWLDVLLFATGAFAGTPDYLSIMQGTLITRFIISLFALPFLYGYLRWQSDVKGVPLENRPVLAILRQVAEIEEELSLAQQEIERRKAAEAALQEAQERLIRQERLAAVGQLTAGLAHVFNNLLAGLLLRTEIALRRQPTDPEITRSLRLLKLHLKEAAALVDKLLDFSRKGNMHRERVDLAPLLQEQVGRLREQAPAGVSLLLDLPASRSEVYADPARVEEIVQNLVSNAQAALVETGTVRITLDTVHEEANCTICYKAIQGKWVRLMVSDDGMGIESKTLPRIFEPFFTTGPPSRNGLGLPQVLGIVKQHHGHIEVESQVGSGTRVSIFLPAAAYDYDGAG